MVVFDKKPVPMYEVECWECHSIIQYKRSEIINLFARCPVCGVLISVIPTSPINKEENNNDVNRS